jgi:hypothetical protein
VRIRSRKPWVLARRRLFGWNVRLLTEELPTQPAGQRLAMNDRHAEGDLAGRRTTVRAASAGVKPCGVRPD